MNDANELVKVVAQWEKRAGRYFVLAEQEKDPLGQKFYTSSAMVYANCAAEIRKWLGPTETEPIVGHSTINGAAYGKFLIENPNTRSARVITISPDDWERSEAAESLQRQRSDSLLKQSKE